MTNRTGTFPTIAAILISTLLLGIPAISPGKDAPLITPSQWEDFYNLRHAAGYRHNVLLSHFVRQNTPLLLTEAEAVLVRLPSDLRGTEVSIFIFAQDIRYLGPGPSNKDQTLIATSQIRHPLSDRWSVLLESSYAYLDQVFDISVSLNDRGNLKSQVHQGIIKPALRYQMGERSRLETGLTVERSEFLAPADDDWAIGPQFTFIQEYGNRSQWSLAYELRRRIADTLARTDPTGTPIDGQTAARNEHEFEFELRHYWDESRRWRTTTKLEANFYRHQGSPFYDYDRFQIAQDLRYRQSPWEARLRARYKHYVYDIQPVTPTVPTERLRNGINLELKVDFKFAPKWKAFLINEAEFSRSNRPTDDYTAFTIYAGIDREF